MPNARYNSTQVLCEAVRYAYPKKCVCTTGYIQLWAGCDIFDVFTYSISAFTMDLFRRCFKWAAGIHYAQCSLEIFSFCLHSNSHKSNLPNNSLYFKLHSNIAWITKRSKNLLFDLYRMMALVYNMLLLLKPTSLELFCHLWITHIETNVKLCTEYSVYTYYLALFLD